MFMPVACSDRSRSIWRSDEVRVGVGPARKYEKSAKPTA
jgi:hypothetical protein